MKRKNSIPSNAIPSSIKNINDPLTPDKTMTISDVFEIYSPPPLQNKSNKLLKSHHSLEETIPPFDIPNVDICHDLESRLQYDPTYANSIMQYKLSVENKYVFKQIPSKFPEMVNSIQQEITKTMYAILIDWLIEIGTISDHTLCLSIHILDEYLQTAVIARSHFQLVGCACLLIAAKLEEIQFPSIDDLVTVACNCFTPEEMILMEQKILRTLNYDISRPTRSYFLERYLLVSRVDCVDLQGKKKFRPALFSTPPPSSFPAPWARNNPSPAPSALTDEEFSSNYFSEISSSHSDPTIHSSQSGSLSTPTKPSHPEAVNSLDDIDLTSAESHSQFHLLSPYLPHTSSFTHHAPQHGFVPTNSRFLREESFARMLLHLTLQDYSFNQYPMSKIAAAIVHLTKQHHRPQSEPLWSRTMQYYTNYTEEELMPIIQHLSHAHHTLLSSKYRSIFNKFDTRSHKFCCTSVLALPVSKLRYDHQHSNTSRQSQMKDCGHSPGHLFHGKNTTPKKTPLHKIQQPSRSINH